MRDDKLSALALAGFDAESLFRNLDLEIQEACVDADGVDIFIHLVHVTEAATVEEAADNIRRAVATVDLRPLLRHQLRDVRDTLVGELEEVGLSLHEEKAS